ncbi:hypothetical protein BDV10DRAFT_189393 [Aspergillus recurvatus]
MKNEYCGTFIPIAVGFPFVLPSVLSLAAVHRRQCGLGQDAKQLVALEVAAIGQLRAGFAGRPTESLIADILMLCYSEVIAGREKNSSWRLRLEDAASLLSCDSSVWSIYSLSRSTALIARCFVSLVAVANMSRRPPSALLSDQGLRQIGGGTPTTYSDDFLGYSSDLVPKFCEIGTLIAERAHLSGKESPGVAQLDLKSVALIQELIAMIDKAHAVLPARNSKF